jgi:capsular exopolysaccharide synthesis family protein
MVKVLDERSRRCTWMPQSNTTLFIQGKSHAPGAEEFRSLRAHLYLIRAQQPVRKLLITSSLPKEGKSFTAVNLSFVLAHQPECRVLLVDADLRLPDLHRVLGTASTPGLSDYLAGEIDEFSVVQRGPLPNFCLIPSGKSVSNPNELIGNGRLKLLLDRLTPAFDWIILDSPPAIPVSDAKLLAGLCDGVLMLVRAGKTPYDLAKKACQTFHDNGLLGVVLNHVRGDAKFGYYYGQNGHKSKK